MIAGNYNIGELSKVLYQAMAGVSTNIFTSRPETVSTAMMDFVVVSFPTRIYDRLGIGNTTCRVSVYARNKVVNNITYEDITKLQTLQNAVYARLPITNTICLIDNPVPVWGGNDKLGFHCLHIQLDVTIL
jgi:hypothetical protein